MHETLVQTLTASTRWPLPVVVAVALLGVAVVIMTWRNVRHVRTRRRRVLLLLLRTLTVLLFLVVFLEPVRRERRIRRVRNHVAVVVDVSRSMETPAGTSERAGTRADRARAFVDSILAEDAELARDHDVHWYTFGERLDAFDPAQEPEALKPRSDGTRTLEALGDLARGLAGRDLAAVILVTDAVDNGALSILQRGQRQPVREVRRVLERLGAPIHLVRTTGQAGIPDLRVAEVRAPSFTFVMNAASLDATVEVWGPIPERIEITLYEDGKPARTERLPTVPDRRSYDVTLPFLPRRVGEHVYTVRVSPGPEERYVANNERSVLVPAIRDRIRVLQVAGHPSYDQRFLRDYLKSNANVDLVSFFILVDPHDQTRQVPASETALIPFPVRELFEEELPGFDLVVFQDFEYRPLGVGRYLPHLKSFVENGGALAVIGGPRSFERGGYQGTLLEEILPVTLHQKADELSTDDTPFRPRVTRAGEHHPVLRLLPDPRENASLLAELPPLEGVNRVVGARPDSTVLLRHPVLRGTDNQNLPVLTLREVGMGRTFALATDSLWRWNFLHAGAGGDSFSYNRFWTATLSWLLRDPEMNPLRLVVEPSAPREGEPVQIRLQVGDPSFRPAPNHPFELEIFQLTDPTDPSSEAEVQHDVDRRSDGEGRARLTFVPPGAGVYRVVAKATFDARTLETERRLVVDPGSEERSRVHDPARLVDILVEASKGRTFEHDADPDDLELTEPEVLLVARERERPLWSHASVLFVAILLLGAEWALRKRSGLP